MATLRDRIGEAIFWLPVEVYSERRKVPKNIKSTDIELFWEWVAEYKELAKISELMDENLVRQLLVQYTEFCNKPANRRLSNQAQRDKWWDSKREFNKVLKLYADPLIETLKPTPKPKMSAGKITIPEFLHKALGCLLYTSPSPRDS